LAPLEVLIVDDASSDDTELAARRCELQLRNAGIDFKYFRLPCNAGPSAARNEGIREAKGTYIAFLDADDTWALDKLAIVDQFASKPNTDLICHGYTVADLPSEVTQMGAYAHERISLYRMLIRNPASTSCAVVRRLPGLYFDESMRYCEEYDLWMRIAEHSPVLFISGRQLTRLGRPQLTRGGLSGDTIGMRIGQIRVFYNFCRRSFLYRAWLLPGLLIYSVSKHAYSWLRRRRRDR
jgi:glycosyltransferase involved in cell wall biosynthesis